MRIGLAWHMMAIIRTMRLGEVNVRKFLKHLGGTDCFFQVEVAVVALEFVCHTDC